MVICRVSADTKSVIKKIFRYDDDFNIFLQYLVWKVESMLFQYTWKLQRANDCDTN